MPRATGRPKSFRCEPEPDNGSTKEICHMKLSILFLAAAALLAGCATGPSYESQVLDRPLPTTQEDRMRECTWIRSEIARQQSLAQYGAATATSPMMAVAYQSAARRHIAALESRAANVQCQAAFSSVVASPSPPHYTMPTDTQPDEAPKHYAMPTEAQPAQQPAQQAPAAAGHLNFDQCFARCRQLTSRTKNQCFDACK
jgi:hypothetical protein